MFFLSPLHKGKEISSSPFHLLAVTNTLTVNEHIKNDTMNCGLLSIWKNISLVLILLSFFVLPGMAVDNQASSDLSARVNSVEVIVDETIENLGFVVNGEEYTGPVSVLPGGEVTVTLKTYPARGTLTPVIYGSAEQELGEYSIRLINIQTYVTLILTISGDSSDIPVIHPLPDTPDDPETPPTDKPSEDNPSENPDTPGPDEPLVPILPPAGNVYNIAGVIPLFAGFFLLFLLFFWRRKVYRILKKHAKQHGEKPERKQLKATADAIIQLIRDEEKYPKWRKNSELTTRLSADIVSALDEMQYPKVIPRDAVVADIIKSAKGRINRHRL